MNFASTPNRVRRPDKIRKTCLFPNCGEHFLGHLISKYCDKHRGVRAKKPKVFVKDPYNEIIKHGLQQSCRAELVCKHPGCEERFRVTFLPRQNVYPMFCNNHRSMYRRTGMDVKVDAVATIVEPETIIDTIPITPPDNPAIDDQSLLDAFVVGGIGIIEVPIVPITETEDGDDDDAIIKTPYVATGEELATVSAGDAPLAEEDKPAKKFFDPDSVASAMGPSSDDDAGIVSPARLSMRTVLVDGKEIVYSKEYHSHEFPVELQGFIARFKTNQAITDYYKTLDDAMATISTDDSGVYYRAGDSDGVIVSGSIDICVGDVRVRRYDSNVGQWTR